MTVLVFFGAAGLTLGLWFLGPGVLGEMKVAQNDRQLVSHSLQFCSKVGAKSEEELSEVSATLFLTDNIQQQDILEQCSIPNDGESYCYLHTPIDAGYFVFIETNSSLDVSDSFNEFSFICKHRIWLYVAIALLAAVCMLTCGFCLVACFARLCRTKRKEQNDLFIYTPLIDHSQEQEHSLIVGSIPSSSPTKKQDSSTLQLEASSSYRYSTFKEGTKPGGTLVSKPDTKHSKAPEKPKKESCNPRSFSTDMITFDTFKSQ